MSEPVESIKTVEYRGCTIEPITPPIPGKWFEWVDPERMDADWNGQSWTASGTGTGSSITDCCEQIDEWLEELNDDSEDSVG